MYSRHELVRPSALGLLILYQRLVRVRAHYE